MTPESTLAYRGAVGETLVTPSGRGLGKPLGQRQWSTERDRPPINKNSLDWILHRFAPNCLSYLPHLKSSPCVVEGSLLEVCGLVRATKRKLKIAYPCLANKE